MEKDINKELVETREGFLQALSLFTSNNFNKIPFEGSWTAGQVAEHVFKSLDGSPQLLSAEGIDTDRDPSMHVPYLRALFLDFSTKMKSPKPILPSDVPKDQAVLTHKLETEFNALLKIVGSIDQNLIVAGFEFPGLGLLTRVEMLNLLSVHIQRHEHQLRKIAKFF